MNNENLTEESSLFFLKLLVIPLSIIFSILPLNKKVWIFGTGVGKKYNDNSKYLFEYICNEHSDRIKPIWLTKDKDVFKFLTKEGRETYEFYSLKGIYFSIISGVAIVSTSWTDLPFTTYINPRKKLVQLWHGTSLKKGNLKVGSWKIRFLRNTLISYLGREFDMITTAANINIKVHASKTRFNVDREKVKVTGQPRTDIFFIENSKLNLLKKKPYEKVFLYLPTWRNYSINFFDAKYGFSFKEINQFLVENKSYLIIKLHPKDYKTYKKIANKNLQYKRIKFEFIDDIYPYLPNVDYFITDYSSIYFDLLMLNKPVIFVPIDIEDYTSDMGFYYDYSWVCAGPIVNDWSGAVREMKEIIGGKDGFKKRRDEINKVFNKYLDGRNSQRVFKEIIKLL